MVRARRLLIAALVLISVALLTAAAVHRGAVTIHAAASPTPNLLTDPNNCGALHFRVPTGDVCRGGIATPG